MKRKHVNWSKVQRLLGRDPMGTLAGLLSFDVASHWPDGKGGFLPPKFEFLKLELAAETLAASVVESLVAGRASRPVTAPKFPSFPTA